MPLRILSIDIMTSHKDKRTNHNSNNNSHANANVNANINSWKTGDLVLCKVGSFPPWPAVIFPQRFLRDDVYKKKKPERIAVSFFNDPTYYWEFPHKLMALTPKLIDSTLKNNSNANSMNDALFIAYKEAKKYIDLESFITAKFIQEDRLSDYSDEIDLNGPLINGEDPFITKEMLTEKQNDSSNSYNDNDKFDNKGEEDGGEFSSKNRNLRLKLDHNGITNIKSKTITTKKRSHSKLDISRQTEIASLFRRRIQANLIQRDEPPTIEGIKESHKLLNKIYENLDTEPPFFDLTTLRKTKLHKLLRVIVNNYKLEEFHQICKDILSHWATMIIQLKKEREEAKKTGKKTIL